MQQLCIVVVGDVDRVARAEREEQRTQQPCIVVVGDVDGVA